MFPVDVFFWFPLKMLSRSINKQWEPVTKGYLLHFTLLSWSNINKDNTLQWWWYNIKIHLHQYLFFCHSIIFGNKTLYFYLFMFRFMFGVSMLVYNVDFFFLLCVCYGINMIINTLYNNCIPFFLSFLLLCWIFSSIIFQVLPTQQSIQYLTIQWKIWIIEKSWKKSDKWNNYLKYKKCTSPVEFGSLYIL